MPEMGALSVIDIIRKFKDARKIVAGKLDGTKLDSVKGKVKLVVGKIQISATYKLEGERHAVEAQRAIVGERAKIKLDGTLVAEPDIDIRAGLTGLKIVVKYILQYVQDGESHQMKLYAIVRPFAE